jgi:hypothetical protein
VTQLTWKLNRDKAASEILRASAMQRYVPSPQCIIPTTRSASNSPNLTGTPNPVGSASIHPKPVDGSPNSPEILVAASSSPDSVTPAAADKGKQKDTPAKRKRRDSTMTSNVEVLSDSPDSSPPRGKKGCGTPRNQMSKDMGDHLRQMEHRGECHNKKLFCLLESQKETQDRVADALIALMAHK